MKTGEEGDTATDGASGQNAQASFEEAFATFETARRTPQADDDSDADDEVKSSDGDDDSLFENSDDDSKKTKDGGEEDEDEEDDESDKSKSKKDDDDEEDGESEEKKKATDEDADDKSKKKKDDDESEKGKKPEDRAGHHAALKAKAAEFDQLNEKYADIGGVKGFEDFANLIQAYKDPAKIEDFLLEIDALAPAHRDAIVEKIFYNALDVPENRVEIINDALLEISEISDLKISQKDLVKDPEELRKIIAYVGFMLDDDRDDFFDTIDRALDKIEFTEDGKARQTSKREPKTEKPQSGDAQNPADSIRASVADFEALTASILDEKVTPILESRGFKATTKDPVNLAKAKTRLTAMIRETAKNDVMRTALGEEVITHLDGLKAPGDKPSAIVKNVAARYRTAIETTAKRVLDEIGPAMRGIAAKKAKNAAAQSDDSDQGEEGSAKIIDKQADKKASLESDDKNKVDWRKDKDPFTTRLTQIGRKVG